MSGKVAYNDNDEVVLYMGETTGNNRSPVISRVQSLPSRPISSPVPIALGPSYVSLPTLGHHSDNREYSTGLTYGSDDNVFSLRPPALDFNEYHDHQHYLLRRAYIPSTATSIVIPAHLFDVNAYQQKKTLAQGMMDLALISSNANQLRYLLQSWDHPYHAAAMTMIIASLVLQIAVGIGLIWNSRYDVKQRAHIVKANRSNNLTVVGIFLVTILNVFIVCFGINPGFGGNDFPRHVMKEKIKDEQSYPQQEPLQL